MRYWLDVPEAELAETGWSFHKRKLAEAAVQRLELAERSPDWRTITVPVRTEPKVFAPTGWFGKLVERALRNRWARKIVPAELRGWYDHYYTRITEVRGTLPGDVIESLDLQRLRYLMAGQKPQGVLVTREALGIIAHSDDCMGSGEYMTLKLGTWRGVPMHLAAHLCGKLAIMF